ncbi:P-loop domain-containing protein [Nonomuraea angiospora]|uniref:hypothetical protein n=1 Tax=Nonomuraea angiospora TaxID=46172 RepID=UPI0029B12A35|nr:hypothetical protein [Nonomuraea angiospora]MDX3110174.1 hypothetical protein [Nonomuraea angiospora]
MGESERWKVGVRGTGAASAEFGGYANSGIHIGDVYQELPARSAYMEQVEQIFPWTLQGRETELAELAAFCSSEDGPGYVWWQGPAWAGKSALMATLVLHPPPKVRVASFFITARYAGQSDRQAFLDVMLPQLAELLGQSLPPLLNASTQQGWFIRLLKEAARTCLEVGEQLVLVVDGLDEDQGVTVGPGSHSIAALLPAIVTEGLRVVVTGRPNPPLPSDVPARHPLRDSKIVRTLTPSPAAQVIREDAERELDHMLHGHTDGRDLLGLIVAAGGGLSVDDLAELTASPPGMIKKWVHGVSGRTFTGRDNRWRPGVSAKAFVLAHEELQESAVELLGQNALSRYRDRIHAWAQDYCDRGWPLDTPEYLLRGYHHLLGSLGDLDRMVDCATDWARLNRMLDFSGGDAAALAEIMACQDIICGNDNPNLTAMLRLAYTRLHLTNRNTHLPEGLPAVWAMLGNCIRAEALAHSITEPYQRASGLTELAGALFTVGELDRAHRITREAEELVRSIDDAGFQVQILAELARILAKAGELEHARRMSLHAESLASPIGNIDYQVIMDLVGSLTTIGELDRARRIAHEAVARAPSNEPNAHATVGLVNLMVAARKPHQAKAIAYSTSNSSIQAQAIAALASALASAGELHHARVLAEDVKAISDSISSSNRQSGFCTGLIEALAAVGEFDQAEALARSATSPFSQALALTGLAGALITVGELDRARRIAYDAEDTVRAINDADLQARVLAKLAGALATAGDLHHARHLAHDVEGVARSITNPELEARALTKLIDALATAGDLHHARHLAHEVERIARSITNPSSQADALGKLATALTETGELHHAQLLVEDAEAIARSITNLDSQVEALAGLLGVLAAVGKLEHARLLAHEVERVARSIANPSSQADALGKLARALTRTRELHHAQIIAHSITDSKHQDWVLMELVEALAKSGELDHAIVVAECISDSIFLAQALVKLAGVLAANREFRQAQLHTKKAEAAARSITDLDFRAPILAELVGVLAATGELRHARLLAQEIEAVACSITDLDQRASVLTALLGGLASMGEFNHAQAMVRSVAYHPYAQSRSILAIVDQCDSIQSRRVLAWGLANGHPVEMLKVIAQSEPAAVRSLGQLMCREWKQLPVY